MVYAMRPAKFCYPFLIYINLSNIDLIRLDFIVNGEGINII